MKSLNLLAVSLVLCAIAGMARANGLQRSVDMKDKGTSTFYVDVYLKGAGLTEFLVDTGSSYTAINERTLKTLLDAEQAVYVKDLEGILADGSTQIVPVYAIQSLTIGQSCALHDIRAAVFPGNARNILGLSALRLAAPFVFSVEPPMLELSNCNDPGNVIADRSSVGSATPD